MGGYNSGRRSTTRTTSDLRDFDIRRIQKSGLFIPGQSFNWKWLRNGEPIAAINIEVGVDRVVLRYRQSWYGAEWERRVNSVRFTWTNCHFGGRRAWWICPACNRKVALLYCGKSNYACRKCSGLAYQSQRETQPDLAARRADKLRKRLGWKAGILNPSEGKPKGMHWRTYWRLRTLHDQHARVVFKDIATCFGMDIKGTI